jgi:hypothetical protein
MVRKIVVDLDAANRTAQLHTPLDVFERRQCRQALRERHPDVPGGQQGGERVEPIVRAAQPPLHAADACSPCHSCSEPVGVIAIGMPALRVVEAFDRRPAAARQDPLQTGLGGIRQKQAIARQGAHQMVELRLDRRQIGEDVGMIELEVVQDRRSRESSG